MKTLGWRLLWLMGSAAACGGGSSGPDNSPSQVVASAGDNQIGAAGAQLSIALEVTVKDASGNPLPNITVTWAAASGGGSVTPASNTTGADGKATATRTLGPGAGPQSTTATVSGVAPATFHHIAQIMGATQISANSPLTRSDSVLSTATFSAVVRDQNNQLVAGVIVAWSLTGGPGTLSQAADTSDASGVVSTNLILDATVAPRSVQAAVTGLQGSPVQFIENAVAGNATQAALNGGNFQVGPVSGPLPNPLSVLVKDVYGNPKQGTSVTWKLQGVVTPASTSTNASGVASLTRTLGASTGAYHDTAFVAFLTVGPDTIVFTDTAAAVTTVQVQNNFFQPTPDTVAAGTFVTFAWAGGVGHNVTWDTGPLPLPVSSPTQSSGTFTVRLTQIGTYEYYCSIHGGPGVGMHGTLVAK